LGIAGFSALALLDVTISTVLRGVNLTVVAAANFYGAAKLRTLLRVELPLVRPGLLSAVIWMLTVAIPAFDVPGVIGMADNICTFNSGKETP
jgi:iron(III) transport system permease protein